MSTREAFEKYALSEEMPITINPAPELDASYYHDFDTECHWRTWQAAMESQSKSSEYCCEHSWQKAKDKAWGTRDFSKCKCDIHESCDYCFPPDFHTGGKFDLYKPQPPKEKL